MRDLRFKEWIFDTGGSRRREIYNPKRCALRELEEETRGVISLKNGQYTEFKFIHKERPTVDLEYNVFIFFVNYTRSQPNAFVRRFYEKKQKTSVKKALHQPNNKTYQ